MDDRYAINAAKSEIREGYNAGDVERILAVYLDGYGDLSDGYPSFGGTESKAVFRERLTRLFEGYRVEFVPVMMSIELFGNAALDCGWHQLTLHAKTDGATTLTRTRYLELWRRRGDGTWGVALFLDNADQTPKLAAETIAELRGEPTAGVLDQRVPNSTQSL